MLTTNPLMWEQDGIILFCKNCETCQSVQKRFVLFCFVATETSKVPLLCFFRPTIVFLTVPTGGPAEGDADQLPVPGGGVCFVFLYQLYRDQLRVNKRSRRLMGGGGEVERTNPQRSRAETGRGDPAVFRA